MSSSSVSKSDVDISSSSSSNSGGNGTPSHDTTSKQDLFNSSVTKVEHVSRPMRGSLGDKLGIPHSGVVLTTKNERLLVEKSKADGQSGPTTVSNASQMSGDWVSIGSKEVQSATKVSDYVEASGYKYDFVTDNCHHASWRMMEVADKDKT